MTKSISSFFDKIFVTTIETHTDRRLGIEDRLLGLPFEYFSEVDVTNKEFENYTNVKDFPDSFFLKYNLDREYAQCWSRGQLGCFANYIALVNHAIVKEFKSIIIFEDDVILDSNALQILEKACNQLPEDWDMLILGYQGIRYTHRALRWFYRLRNLIMGVKFKTALTYTSNLDIPPNSFSGGYAVAMSFSGMKKLLNQGKHIREFGDVLFPKLVDDPNFQIFSVYPQIARVLEFSSSTQ